MRVTRLNGVIAILYGEIKDLSDEGREIPILWNVMHMFSSSQIAKILALHRGEDAELASIACVLHDIAVVRTKEHQGHAEKAERYVREVIAGYNGLVRDASLAITGTEENVNSSCHRKVQ